MSNLIEVLTGGMIIIVGLTLAYLITKFAGYWSEKRTELSQLIAESEKVQKIPYLDYLLEKVLNVVDDVVGALNSTMKQEILDATADKKLTKEEGKAIRDKAVSLIKDELPESIWDELNVIIGDSEEFLKTAIEQSVEKQKYIEIDADDDEDTEWDDVEE